MRINPFGLVRFFICLFLVIYRDKRWYIYTKCENLTL